jgi:hypothetical protein
LPNHWGLRARQRLWFSLEEAAALFAVVRQNEVAFPQRLLRPGLIR